MIILGINSDDKGNQLEQLTKLLLSQLGYTDIVKNEVNAGGDEIDISATFIQPTIKTNIKHEVICECKAYRAPTTMPDWLKFLGKLYAREHGPGGRVQGCFIALNGVNGNVSGHFRALRVPDGDVQIIAGDDLINLIKKGVEILPAEGVIAQVSLMTSKTVTGTELIYYKQSWYWLIEFSNEMFTVFSSDGKFAALAEDGEICGLIKANTGLKDYVDLAEESESRLKIDLVQRFILSSLLIEGKAVTRKKLRSHSKYDQIRSYVGQINENQIADATKNLEEMGFVIQKSGKLSLENRTANQTLSLLRYLLDGTVFLTALYSAGYQQLIGSDLLTEICIIQGGLVLADEDRNDYLQLLKSPSALLWACTPDAFLVTHSKNTNQIPGMSDKIGHAYFYKKIVDRFTSDYQGGNLGEYFHNICGIVEVETDLKIKIKGKQSLLAESKYNERLGLGQMADEFGGGIVAMIILPDQPEPWIRYNDPA